MPQPETLKQRDAFESKTMWCIFVGCHVAPGGLHTCDYLIADYVGKKRTVLKRSSQALRVPISSLLLSYAEKRAQGCELR